MMKKQKYSEQLVIAAGQNLKERDYWLNKLSGELEKTIFPYDFPKPAHEDKGSEVVNIIFPGEISAKLIKLSGGSDPRLHMILAAAAAVLLRKYSYKRDREKDIMMGIPIYKQVVEGEFINTMLTLRITIEDHMTFKELLLNVRKTIIEAAENQCYPIEILIKELNLQDNVEGFPLFDVVILLENIHDKMYLAGINPRVTFSFSRKDSTIEGVVEFNPLFYEKITIQRIIRHFLQLLGIILGDVNSATIDIDILSQEEKKHILMDFNNTQTRYPGDKTIDELLAEQVEQTPDRIAVVFAHQQLTYGELNHRANQLAAVLAERGTKPGTILAIMLDRSLEMIVGIMAILNSGCAYLPIEPGYPGERKKFVLEDSGTPLLLTQQKYMNESSHISEIINIEDDRFYSTGRGSGEESTPKKSNKSGDLAYVIYTSGTTGKPKGTLTTHYNAIRVVKDTNYINLTVDDRILQLSNYAFDGSIFDIYGALLNGAVLIMLKWEDVLAVDRLSALILKEKITVFFVTTALFNTLVELNIECLGKIRNVLFGGEKVSVDHSKRAVNYLGKDRVIHVYGPTETTVYATYYSINEIDERRGTIPIGQPLANTTVYILDEELKPVPLGVNGELYIGGHGVARGYLNHPELTAEKFIRDPFTSLQADAVSDRHPVHLFYKTGDLARWLPGGLVEFIGRIDRQVKIRGFRIEPEEIANRILEIDGINAAVVVPKIPRDGEKGDKYLCAYIVSRQRFSAVQLKEHLAAQLPEFMVPSYFVQLETIPLNPNGKVDLKALPEPGWEVEDQYIAPRDRVEEKMAEVWSEVLDIEKEKIGIDTDFFELGGHSLKATTLASKLRKAFDVNVPLREIFHSSTIRKLSQFIKESIQDKYVAMKSAEEKEYYFLSSAQRRLYILQQIDLSSTVYNMPMMVPLQEEANIKKLEETFLGLIRRHESLRTSFHMIENQPIQKVHKPEELSFSIKCLDMMSSTSPNSMNENFVRAFDLSKAPLMRVGLVHLAENRRLLLVDMHHIISDGVSHDIMTDEFMKLYRGEALPELRLEYKDYAHWQTGESQMAALKRQESYWLRRFEGEIPVLELTTDYPRPAVQSFEGHAVDFEIGREETEKLKQLALQEKVTLYMVLLGLYNVLLSKLSGQEDIVVGTPIAGRRHADLQQIIGMFVNTLALRNFPTGEKTFSRFLSQLKESTLDAFENQDYPFEQLVEQVEINRDASRNPLFDVMFSLQNIGEDREGNEGNEVNESIDGEEGQQGQNEDEYQHRVSKFDMTLTAVDYEDNVFFTLEYSTKLFHEETIQQFIGYFKRILAKVLVDREIKISGIEIISEVERRQILDDFNDTNTNYPGDKTIHQLFAEQVEKNPDRTAVVGSIVGSGAGSGTVGEWDRIFQITSGELNQRSNQLAAYLQSKGVKDEEIVGLMVDTSLEMIIGILAVLKVGGVYMPINPDYPGKRKKYLMRDANVKILMTNYKESNNEQEVIQLDNFDVNNYSEEGLQKRGHYASLAYIIYTSGSTGNPKGVMVEHQCVVRLVRNTNYLEFREGDRILQTGALEFDASTFEIWGALLNGLELFLFPREMLLTAGKLKETLCRYAISTVWMTSPLFNQMVDLDIEIFQSLGNLLVGGDVLSPNHINRVKTRFPHLSIINGYGPTENTTFSTTFAIKREYEKNIPIGKPIANSTAFILDKYDHLVPPGIVGELVVGGDGIARGYLNQPELTMGKFVEQVTSGPRKQRLYKTGDLARSLWDGNIEFLGRIDHQVKIRGFRIEMGEIEVLLLKHENIDETVVTIYQSPGTTDKYICAYIVAEKELAIERVREYLSKNLPDYMIPSYFIQLEEISLTPNGKVDRNALPEPGITLKMAYIPPQNEIEEKLSAIWSEVLGLEKDQLSTNANFFELGGHSLKATILVSLIHKELEVRLPLGEVFKTPTIKGLANLIKMSAAEEYIGIEPEEEREYYGLSYAQKRLYILHQVEPEGIGYNMPLVIPLEEEVDIKKLEETFIKLIDRHASFRTSFHMIRNQPVQRVHRRGELSFSIEYHDMMDSGSSTNIIENFVRAFDLSEAPLLRVGSVHLAEARRLLLVDMHHIISDGVSHDIMTDEFMKLYRGEALPELRLEYKDYAHWQTGESQMAALKRQESYWLRRFEGEIPVLELTTDYPRPAVQSFEGHAVDFEIGREETEKLKQLALQEKVTLYMVLLGLYNVLLSKLSGQEDIVVGTPIAGRRHADLQQIIGMFVNTLALRNFPTGEKTFSRFLSQLKESTLDAFENQDYPFEDLVEKVKVNRDISRNPLFDVMFTLHSPGENGAEITRDENPAADRQEPEQTQHGYEYRVAKFDMTFSGLELGNRLLFTIEYSTRLFKKETIERFITFFKRITADISRNPEGKISGILMISPEERKQILCDFNNTEAAYPKDKTIVELIEKQVQRTPHHIAAAVQSPGDKRSATCTPGNAVTYRELNHKSNQLARLLREKGVTPDTIVGIMVERSLEMLIGMMGILKAGMAYLPVAPDLPAARKKYMLEDSAVKVLLTQKYLLEEYMDDSEYPSLENIFHIEGETIYRGKVSNVRLVNQPGDLAYMMYTSGSTGNPKGVMVEQGSVVNLLSWFGKTFNIQPGTRVLMLTEYTFDPSIEDIWGIFIYGGTLYIAGKEIIFNRKKFCQFVKKNRISLIDFVPDMLRELLCHEEKLESLEVVISGGERLEESLKDQIIEKGYRLYNNYGPTEITVDALSAECSPGKVNLGKPIDNMRCYIADENDWLQPVGIPGELCIAGKGLARGYLNRQELTHEKFIQSPFAKERLYRTGDLTRWLPDGKIEFLGRKDEQLKIRGYRVEPGEIEYQLLNIEDIKEAVVISPGVQGKDKYICAYIVSEKEVLVSELREYLSHQLPAYMIPAFFVFLDRIPLTPNGKVDRQALPEPEITLEQAHVTPRDEVEKKLAAIWSGVLGLEEEKISMEVNFFELGGHSLKATVLATQIHNRLQVRIPVIEVFKRPTIRRQAEYINTRSKQKENHKPLDNKLVPLREINGGDKHLFLVHDGSGEVEGYIDLCNRLTNEFNCWGINADKLVNDAPKKLTIENLAFDYVNAIQTIQPQEPYCIAGWSIGGTIAFEMVRKLEQRNKTVKFFALIDVPPPQGNLREDKEEFTVGSELNWIQRYLPEDEIHEQLKNVTGIEQLWTRIVDYLEIINADVEMIKKIIKQYEGYAIPNYDHLSIRELIRYLNVGRGFSSARAFYMPAGKISTPAYYFEASQSKGRIKADVWNHFIQEPVQVVEIPGDHYSILQAPSVKNIAEKFDEFLERA
jgi:tyrocidine synthetase-3